MSESERRRSEARERAALIAKLGMAPEKPGKENRYAATTGELWSWVAEEFGIDEADRIRSQK